MPAYANPDALVSTEWLARHLDHPAVKVVDATYFLPNAGKNGRTEYLQAHIPGTVYFDIEDISDESPAQDVVSKTGPGGEIAE